MNKIVALIPTCSIIGLAVIAFGIWHHPAPPVVVPVPTPIVEVITPVEAPVVRKIVVPMPKPRPAVQKAKPVKPVAVKPKPVKPVARKDAAQLVREGAPTSFDCDTVKWWHDHFSESKLKVLAAGAGISAEQQERAKACLD